jgi:hypothetical protein
MFNTAVKEQVKKADGKVPSSSDWHLHKLKGDGAPSADNPNMSANNQARHREKATNCMTSSNLTVRRSVELQYG